MKAKFIKNTRENIDLREWNLESIDIMKTQLGEIINEVFACAVCDDARISLPYYWAPECDGMGGKAVTDPLAIRIELPLGENEDNAPAWSASFGDLMRQEIEGMDDNQCGEKEGETKLMAWRAELMKLVNAIDVRMDKNKKARIK